MQAGRGGLVGGGEAGPEFVEGGDGVVGGGLDLGVEAGGLVVEAVGEVEDEEVGAGKGYALVKGPVVDGVDFEDLLDAGDDDGVALEEGLFDVEDAEQGVVIFHGMAHAQAVE